MFGTFDNEFLIYRFSIEKEECTKYFSAWGVYKKGTSVDAVDVDTLFTLAAIIKTEGFSNNTLDVIVETEMEDVTEFAPDRSFNTYVHLPTNDIWVIGNGVPPSKPSSSLSRADVQFCVAPVLFLLEGNERVYRNFDWTPSEPTHVQFRGGGKPSDGISTALYVFDFGSLSTGVVRTHVFLSIPGVFITEDIARRTCAQVLNLHSEVYGLDIETEFEKDDFMRVGESLSRVLDQTYIFSTPQTDVMFTDLFLSPEIVPLAFVTVLFGGNYIDVPVKNCTKIIEEEYGDGA